MTLPLILAARESHDLRHLLEQLVAHENPNLVASGILKIVQATGIIDEVKAHAARHTATALDALGKVQAVDPEIFRVLSELSEALLNRDF